MRYEVKKMFKPLEHEEGKNKGKKRKYNNDNNNIELRRKFFRQCIPPTKKGEKVLVTKSPKFSVDCYYFEVSFLERRKKRKKNREEGTFSFCVLCNFHIIILCVGQNEININSRLYTNPNWFPKLNIPKKKESAPISISLKTLKVSFPVQVSSLRSLIEREPPNKHTTQVRPDPRSKR